MISQPTDFTTQSFRWWKYLLGSVALVVLLGFIFWQPIQSFVTDTWHCMTTECNPHGPAASWQDQFVAADSAAHKIQPDLVLHSVSAYPVAYKVKNWLPDEALQINFTYVTSNRDRLTVHLLDTEPTKVWADPLDTVPDPRTELDYYGNYYNNYIKDQANLDAELAAIQISPRQVAAATTDVHLLEDFLGLDARPSINLEFNETSLNGTYWSITYQAYKDGLFYHTDERYPRYPNALYKVDTVTGKAQLQPQPANP